MLDALIFDFDGLIVDSETSDYRSWQETFALFGAELPLSVWVEYIGTADTFDPYAYLQAQLDAPIDRTAVRRERRQRDDAFMAQQGVMPGVEVYLQDAKSAGVRLAIASSSPHAWVDAQLARLGLTEWFEVVCCSDDVDGRGKPDPAVYLAAVEGLGVKGGRVLALEDSPHGVAAAKAAGLRCTAVPNAMTRFLNFDHADYRLDSLADLSLHQLVQEIWHE